MGYFYGNVVDAIWKGLKTITCQKEGENVPKQQLQDFEQLILNAVGNTTISLSAQGNVITFTTLGNDTFTLDDTNTTSPSAQALVKFIKDNVAIEGTIIDCGTSAEL